MAHVWRAPALIETNRIPGCALRGVELHGNVVPLTQVSLTLVTPSCPSRLLPQQ
jgi:hypothetical protein